MTIDLTQGTIQKLFYQQIRNLSVESEHSRLKSFDVQFGDSWIN